MSRPHENDVRWKRKLLKSNAFQGEKIWKHNSIGIVWTGRNTTSLSYNAACLCLFARVQWTNIRWKKTKVQLKI